MADTVDANLVYGLSKPQTCLLESVGEDTLRYDVVMAENVIASELDVDVIR